MWKKVNVALLIICGSIMLLTAGGASAAGTSGEGEYKNAIRAARETIWKAITSGKGSGATVAIMDRGRIVYSEGIGTADRSENRTVDKDTLFNIGSTSKMYIAVAVLLLVDEGKVKLDESVVTYVPEFKMKDERYKDITVRMLFNHSSGLPGSSFFFGYKPYPYSHKIMLDSLRDAHLKHAPGAMSIYCNDGFTLAEIMVEKVSGRKYLDFLTERIFRPLGLNHTSASIGEIKETNAAEYHDPKTGKKYPREAVTVYAAGGLSSTAEDLCRFGDSFSPKGKRILSDASLKEILRTQPTRFSGKLRDGQMMSEFGWEYTNIAEYQALGIQVLGKGGNTNCFSTNLQIVPEQGISIALSISGQASGEALTRPILDALMVDKKLRGEKPKTAERPAEPQPVPAELLGYAGYYTDAQNAVRVDFDKEKKVCRILPLTGGKTAKGKTQPAPVSTLVYNDGYFYDNEKQRTCYFTTVDGRKYIILHKAPTYGVDVVAYQELKRIKRPASLKTDMNGKVWLLRNAPPYVVLEGGAKLLLTASSVYKELPGYVAFAGVKKIEGADFASIAAVAMRDQGELTVFSRNGETWAKSANFLFSCADGFRKVKSGTNTVKIGDQDYNEWIKVEKGAVLSFEKPEGGRMIVVTPKELLFDSVIDSDEIYAPAGSYVFCAGTAGQEFRVHAK